MTLTEKPADASSSRTMQPHDGADGGKYDVGGILLDRPFKIRRLGHFGYSARNLKECLQFYNQEIGFKITDPMNFAANPAMAEKLKGIEDTHQYFMRHGTDHHSFVMADQRVVDRLYASRPHKPTHSINQMTWQVGSLREVVDAIDFFEETGVPINRAGRDMPGSNWHVYPFDPELHRNELYYGIEQIGWSGKPKPKELYERGFHEAPDLPQMSEEEEVFRAEQAGVDLHSGYLQRESMPSTYDVDGVLLPRPFKVVKIGPVGIYVKDVDAVSAYYENIMGFTLTQEITFHGHRCRFLRCNTEHHSLALYPIALRDTYGHTAESTCMGFGAQLANYRQLRDAVEFLKARGRKIAPLPGDLLPGIDYAAAVIDPDGVPLILYYQMDQVAGSGQLTGKAEPANTDPATWPERLAPRPGAYTGEAYLGPWG